MGRILVNLQKLIFLPVLLLTISVAFAGDSDIEFLRSEQVRKLGLPFSDAVRVGNLLFLSGQLGVDHNTGKLAEGGITGQTRRALTNIKRVLENNGSGLSKVVKCTVFLANDDDWGEMSKIYKTFFGDQLPARSAVTVKGLARGGLVEIECIAAV